jgi:hypothetical protein
MQIKTDNFEIDVHDSPDGYYVDVKTKSHLVSVFRTHVVVYENDKALVHVHTSMRKIEVVKEMEFDVTDEP